MTPDQVLDELGRAGLALATMAVNVGVALHPSQRDEAGCEAAVVAARVAVVALLAGFEETVAAHGGRGR